ncbi:LrgB family protein [Shewanella sp. NIFS-20-20]|uniref:LrgB family protein n=1 Tax=Shewanella sp. NIFS-20-20 TaxID=2853806 RepID=UPI001C457533|nr:LrgB family protein [Shewanella sp. NIFS-20-20]MBV7315840.1 LrgB family protein [Shewanella sp. NIFS-20-20]
MDYVFAWGSVLLTLACYYGTKILYRNCKIWFFAPIFLAPLLLILLVLGLDIPLQSYSQYSHYFSSLLAPAVIAFALPIYRERHMIVQYPLTLTFGGMFGLLLGLLSTWGLSQFITLPPELSHSALARSVSTPFALAATTSFGGIPALTAMLVLATGVIGMLIGEPMFKLMKLNSSLGKGMALGASCHGAGTAKATEIGQQEGVIASLTMIFTGVGMVLGAPLFAYCLG